MDSAIVGLVIIIGVVMVLRSLFGGGKGSQRVQAAKCGTCGGSGREWRGEIGRTFACRDCGGTGRR